MAKNVIKNLTGIEILVFLIIGFILCSLPYFFTRDWGIVSFDDVGGIIGGVTAPFLSFFGSILVYMALKTQISANEEIKKQFEKQNQDELFFRFVDVLDRRITNYSIDDPTKNNSVIKSYGILNFFIRKFHDEMNAQCTYFGRHLLAKMPELIGVDYYARILSDNNLTIEGLEDAPKLKQQLIDINDYSERWEFLKSYLNNAGKESMQNAQILNAIGSVYFYKVPFSERYDMYHKLYDNNYQIYGSFFDGYFNNMKYLLKFIDKINDNIFYISFLKSTLTSYEKAFIYYYLASNHSSREFKELIRKYNVLDDLEDFNSFFIDVPSRFEFQTEVEQFLNADQLKFN